MDQLTAITNRLTTDSKLVATITNGMNYQVVCKNVSGETMAEEAGSVVDWFNNLLTTTPKITIQLRRKNGSSYIMDGQPIPLSVLPIDQPGLQAPAPTHHQAYPMAQDPMGLMGAVGLKGIYQMMDHSKMEARNTILESENAALKEKVDQMKEDALKAQFSEDKANGNKEMLNGLLSILPQVLPLLGRGGAAPAAMPGLGQPAPDDEDLSDIKFNLIQTIRELPDYVSDYLTAIINGMNANPEFGKEQMELLKKYSLTAAE